jgi:S-(hydroxymethyl)glutathione dehydrogenase/alcohol dehydrogenase
MQAAVMRANREPLVIEELVAGPLGDDEVEVRVDAAGVCQSDLSLLDGMLPPPAVLGHEGTGIVVRVGGAVSRLRPGDRVIGSFIPVCGRCWFCRNDLSQHCQRTLELVTVARWKSTSGEPVLGASGLGTWAELVRAHEASLVPVRSRLPPDQLALIGCAVTTGVGAAINTAAVKPGSTVAVVGCGGVGQFVIQGALVAGASTIVAIDPNAEKRAHSLSHGATHALDPTCRHVENDIRSLTDGRGVDYAFEVVGLGELVRQAFDATRAGGTVVLVGMPRRDATVELPHFSWFSREKRVIGCNYGSAPVQREFDRLIGMAESGRLDIGAAVTSTYRLSEVNDAIETLRVGRAVRVVIKPDGG